MSSSNFSALFAQPMRLDVYLHGPEESANSAKLDHLINLLTAQSAQESTILMTETEALAVLKKIDEATTAQGLALTQESTNLQTVSDNIDLLIAKAASVPGIPDSVVKALQAESDKVSGVGDALTKQAAFATALASKGAATPVPLPVPPATPPIPPVAVPA